MTSKRLLTYVQLAKAHGRHTLEGNSNLANKAHDELQSVFHSLVESGNAGQLTSLFDYDSHYVQLWAASHSLEINEGSALKKLEELTKVGIPLVSMSAEYTAQGWKSGELRFTSQNDS